jgi:uncharacterized membrane protein
MKARSGVGSLLVGVFVAALSHPAFSHDATKPDGPYHQTDLPELHAIVETVRESAGPEQLAKIDQLVMTAGPELQRLSQRAIVAHRRKVELMLQDVVDRNAFEEAQANELKAAGALSKRIDDALTSLAKTLTPEQRLQFREHNKPHQD